MTTVVVLQPGYLPWLGFFDQMHRCDAFVYYDDVQFDKHGWRNRNRVKSAKGPVWLTVPVLQRGRATQLVNEVEIDNRRPWARKQIATLRQLYAQAPFVDRFLPELEDLLGRPWSQLVSLDIAAAELIARWLGLKRATYRSSELAVTGDRSERLLNICRHFRARRYLSGNAAKEYLDVRRFLDAGVEVEWQDYAHPTYPQLHGPFQSHLSVIDLILNVGDGGLSVIASGRGAVPGSGLAAVS